MNFPPKWIPPAAAPLSPQEKDHERHTAIPLAQHGQSGGRLVDGCGGNGSAEDSPVLMTGPAVTVFEGDIEVPET